MPKITFCYSSPYDLHWREWIAQQSTSNQKSFLEIEEVLGIVKKIEKIWASIEDETFKEISKVLKLNWREDNIPCYIVSNARALSDPLTIGVNNRGPNRVIETLMHELTHRIFIQEDNRRKTKQSWEEIKNKYPDQSKVTHSHIICFSLLKHLYLTFFNQKTLEAEIKRCEKKDDYRKSWEIIEKEGYMKILSEFSIHFQNFN